MAEEEKQGTSQEEKQLEDIAKSSDSAIEAHNDLSQDEVSKEADIQHAPNDNTIAQPADKPEKDKEDSIEELTTIHERTIAAMSYISFLAIIPFYFKKESKFCRFHGKQGLLLAIIFFLMKPLMVLDIVNDLVLILEIVVFAYMGVGALGGKWKKMPWFYNKACQFEDQLSLKNKEEIAEEE